MCVALINKLLIALDSPFGNKPAMFPITLALSYFILGSSSIKVFVTNVSKVSSAIAGRFFVAYSIASMQVALAVPFCVSAKANSSSGGNASFNNQSPICATFALAFTVLLFNNSSMFILFLAGIVLGLD
jgi:hypothetical protein